MIEVLLTAIPSLCWMLFRCYQLFRTPTDKLFQLLNVDIPHTPAVCVDLLTRTLVVIHWDIEVQPDENVFYAVLVNGKDAGTLAQTSAKLCNLEPDTLYRIHILAVNVVSNFRSQSSAVFVRTLPQQLPQPARETPAVAHEPSGAVSMEISPAEVDSISLEQVLSDYLYVFQNELGRLTRDCDALSQHQRDEEARLKAEVEKCKKELNEGSDSRAKMELEVKRLEKRKDTLTFDKLKLLRQVKNNEAQRTMHMNKWEELRQRVGKLTEKKQHVLNTAELEKTKVLQNVEALHVDISELKLEIASTEATFKQLTNERRQLNTQLAQLRPLVEQFVTPPQPLASDENLLSVQGEVFARDGTLTKLGSELLQKLFALKPEWEADVARELDMLLGLEASWRTSYKAAIRRFLAVHDKVQAARASRDPTYEPQRISEYQASIEFGGFSNALPKLAKPKKTYVMELESTSPSPPPLAEEPKWYQYQDTVYGSPPMSTQNLAPPSLAALNVALAPSTTVGSSTAYDFRGANFDSRTSFVNDTVPEPEIDQYYLGGMNGLNGLNNCLNSGLNNGLNGGVSGVNGGLQSMTYPEVNSYAMSPQPSYAQTVPLQNTYQNLPNYLQTYLPEHLEMQLSIPQASMQQYAQNIRQSFPDDYGMKPSTPENSYLYPQLQNLLSSGLWNNPSQSSFLDQRRAYPGLTTLLPPIDHLAPQQDNALLSSLLLSSSTSQILSSNSIWLDKAAGLSHGRTLSSGSQLWRNDRSERTPGNPNFRSEFLPFSPTSPYQGEAERKEEEFSDIWLV